MFRLALIAWLPLACALPPKAEPRFGRFNLDKLGLILVCEVDAQERPVRCFDSYPMAVKPSAQEPGGE